MARSVFILGAGASRSCNVPVMGDFLESAHQIKLGKRAAHYEQDFDRVFRALREIRKLPGKELLGYSIENLEAVFSAFDAAYICHQLSDMNGADDLPFLAQSLEQVIITTIEEMADFPVVNGQVLPSTAYANFARYLGHRIARGDDSIAVITFNYDCCLDYALAHAGVPFVYNVKEYEPTGELPLLKMHGSLNWVDVSKSGGSQQRHVTPESIFCTDIKPLSVAALDPRWTPIGADAAKLPFGTLATEEVPGTTLIVPPTWYRGARPERIWHVWTRAADELREAEEVSVIGFSFPPSDQDVRYFLPLVLNPTAIKSFSVCVPHPCEIKDNYEHIEKCLGDRFKYVPSRFEEVVEELLSVELHK